MCCREVEKLVDGWYGGPDESVESDGSVWSGGSAWPSGSSLEGLVGLLSLMGQVGLVGMVFFCAVFHTYCCKISLRSYI